MKYSFFLILFCGIGCQTHSKKNANRLHINGLVDPKSDKPWTWTQYLTKDSMPTALYQKLNTLSDNKFEIANPKDKFQATDLVTNESLPWRQLRYLAKSETFWVMTYKHGGIDLHYHFIICQIIEDKLTMFKTGTSLVDLDTMHQIEKALADKKISFKELENSVADDKS